MKKIALIVLSLIVVIMGILALFPGIGLGSRACVACHRQNSDRRSRRCDWILEGLIHSIILKNWKYSRIFCLSQNTFMSDNQKDASLTGCILFNGGYVFCAFCDTIIAR